MSDGTKSFFQRWLVTTLGVLVAANIVNGVRAESVLALLAASLLLGVFNAVLRPVLLFVSLPLVIFTLGLFTLVINAVLLYFVGFLVKGFFVADFWSAFKGALVTSIVSLFANLFIGKKEGRVRIRTSQPSTTRKPPPPPDSGGGPIIDV